MTALHSTQEAEKNENFQREIIALDLRGDDKSQYQYFFQGKKGIVGAYRDM